MRWACALAAAALSWGQVTVRSDGGLLSVRGACTAETVQSLSLPCSATEPCALFLELASAEASGNRVFVTGNIHTGSATLESVLLVSEDAGKTWAEAHARLPSAVLDQIQFYDFETGWINGHLLQTLPRDAFLLLTRDGGKTWRRRPVSGEPRTGAIEQFWFDTRTHGMLAIDRVRAGESGLRYELWESMTGGESWSVRQVHHERLEVKLPAREAVWRIRADAGAKANRIEMRENGKWVSVAAFSVDAGVCKPAEAEAPEAPPPTVTESPEPEVAAPPEASPRKPPTLRREPRPR